MNVKMKTTNSILIILSIVGLILGIFTLPEDVVTDFVLAILLLMVVGYLVINFLID